jgi:hypothetical protein
MFEAVVPSPARGVLACLLRCNHATVPLRSSDLPSAVSLFFGVPEDPMQGRHAHRIHRDSRFALWFIVVESRGGMCVPASSAVLKPGRVAKVGIEAG